MHVLDASSNLVAIPRRWYSGGLRLPKPSPLRKVGDPTFNHSSPALFAQFYDAPSPIPHQKRGILPSI
jgi:hypothetical protein